MFHYRNPVLSHYLIFCPLFILAQALVIYALTKTPSMRLSDTFRGIADMTECDELRPFLERALNHKNDSSNVVLTSCVTRRTILSEDSGIERNTVNCSYTENGKNTTRNLVVLRPTSGATESQIANFMRDLKTNEFLSFLYSPLIRVTDTPPFAEIIYFEKMPKPAILEVDQMSNRFKLVDFLTFDQHFQVLRDLAAMHAVSAITFTNKPELRSLAPTEHCLEEDWEGPLKFAFQIIMDNINDWSENKWAEKIRKKFAILPKSILHKTNFPIHVLNHGGVRAKNILLRYRGCGMNDVNFINFRNSCLNTPIIDIIFFIFTSFPSEKFGEEIENCLRTYVNRFSEVYAMLGYSPGLTFEDLKEEFEKNISFAFFTFCAIRPTLAFLHSENIISPDLILKAMKNIYSDIQSQKTLLDGLPYFETKGVI